MFQGLFLAQVCCVYQVARAVVLQPHFHCLCWGWVGTWCLTACPPSNKRPTADLGWWLRAGAGTLNCAACGDTRVLHCVVSLRGALFRQH